MAGFGIDLKPIVTAMHDMASAMRELAEAQKENTLALKNHHPGLVLGEAKPAFE